jgi:hypothetical protein
MHNFWMDPFSRVNRIVLAVCDSVSMWVAYKCGCDDRLFPRKIDHGSIADSLCSCQGTICDLSDPNMFMCFVYIMYSNLLNMMTLDDESENCGTHSFPQIIQDVMDIEAFV